MDPKPNTSISPYTVLLNNPNWFIDPLGDTTEYYNMDGEHMFTINNNGERSRIKISQGVADHFNETMASAIIFSDGNLEEIRQAYVDGLNGYADDLETTFNYGDIEVNLISREISYRLAYTGTLENSSNLISQNSIDNGNAKSFYSEGDLTLFSVFDDNSELTLGSWNARSGPWGNSLMPNGDYEATGIVNTEQSGMVLNGVGWKVYITDHVELNRTLLRIHPDQGQNGSQGCIGLDCPASDLRAFRNHIRRNFANDYGDIPLNFNVPCNPNYSNDGSSTFTGTE